MGLGRLALASLVLAACGSSSMQPAAMDGPPGGPVALYDTSIERSEFFALPWPSDARVLGTGAAARLDLAGFNNPGGTIGNYIDLVRAEPFGGFGTSSAIFFRFDAAIDPASLPAGAAASIDPASTVFVVDVTPGSATAGKRVPVRVGWKAHAGKYIGANSLALLAEPGFPLHPKTTYAAIVTDGVLGVDGAHARSDARFKLPAFPMVPQDVDAAHIVCATVFTTLDPARGMKALRDAVYAAGPAPAIDGGSLKFDGSDGANFDQYEGTFASPIFQQGDPPYAKSGGAIAFDAQGRPQIARVEHLRFMVTVPHADPTPAAGWPVVIYAHGTGGDYSTFVADNSALQAARVTNDNGDVIARMAMISIDQPLHGPRDPTGGNPDLTTFNFQNLAATRDVFRQSGADDFQLLRLAQAIDVVTAPGTGRRIKFDAARIYFKGHSQGGTTGPLFLAFEPNVKAAVLSGAGANLIESLLGKTQPLNFPSLIGAIVGEDLDEFHPLLSLVQAYLEPADPGNYARYFFREPPPMQPPKSVYVSLGLVDHYTPVPCIQALALAMGAQPAEPMLAPIDDLGLDSLAWGTPPLMNNVASGAATGVVCEYQVPNNAKGAQQYDGHFVVFKSLAAIHQSNRFLAHAAASGTAVLDP